MKKNIIILAIVALFVGLFFVQKRVTSLTASVQKKFNVADRYAFISDKQSNNMAVVDVYTHEITSYFQLKAVPKKVAIDKTRGLMFYIAANSKKIYTRDLSTQQETSLDLDIMPDDFVIQSEGTTIAITQLAQPKQNLPSTVSLYRLPDMKLVDTINLAAGKPSMIYSLDGLFLFINDNIGHIWRYSPPSKTLSAIKMFRNNSLNDIYNPITLVPNGKYAIFSSKTTKTIVLWDILENKIKSEFKTMGEPNQPYVSNTSENIVITDNADNAYILDGDSLTLKSKIDISNSEADQSNQLRLAGDIRIGWADSLAVVTSGRDLIVIDLNSASNIGDKVTRRIISAPIVESIVSADSKTYIGVQNDNNLVFLDIAKKKVANVISLKNIKQASHINVGLSNTLCH